MAIYAKAFNHIRDFFRAYRLPILLTLALRMGYSIWSAIIWVMLDPAFPRSAATVWETYYHLTPSTTLAGRAFIDVWLRWDAVHYMNIAAFGYGGVGPGDSVFFPLYPYLAGFLARLGGINVTLAGLLLSSLATLLLLICLWELCLALFADRALARDALLLLALYPTAFFLHAPFTDALFLLCSVSAVLLMLRHQPLLAGLLACAAGLARPQGVLLLLPLGVMLAQKLLRERRLPRWQEITGLVLVPLGFLAYILWRSSAGLSGLASSLQTHSNVRFQNPLATLYTAIQRVISAPRGIEISELVSVLLFLAILIWMVAQPRFRAQPALLLYAAITWLLITSKTTIGGAPLQSANRYVLHMFPVFIGLAALLQNAHPNLRRAVLLFFPALGMVCAALSALWIFVG